MSYLITSLALNKKQNKVNWMDRRTGGWTDGWMNRRMDGGLDGQTNRISADEFSFILAVFLG